MRESFIGAGLPLWQADGLIEDHAHYSRGEAAEVALGVQEATGNPPRSLADFAGRYAEVFSESTAQKKRFVSPDHVDPVGTAPK